MKNVIFTLVILLGASSARSDHGPRIQFINNVQGVDSLDIFYRYENFSQQTPSFLFLEGFKWKEASEFTTFSLIYGANIFIIRNPDSSDTTVYFKASFGREVTQYEKSYIIVIEGDSFQNISMSLFNVEETYKGPNFKTKTRIYNGVKGTESISIDEVYENDGYLVRNLKYKEGDGFFDIESTRMDLQIQNDNEVGLSEFTVPFSNFSNQCVFLLAVGDTRVDSSSYKQSMSLLLVKTDGSVLEIAPKAGFTPSSIQIIHNSIEPKLKNIAVYINNEKIYDDLEFRQATQFDEYPGGNTPFVLMVKDESNPDSILLEKTIRLRSSTTNAMVITGLIDKIENLEYYELDARVYSGLRQLSKRARESDVCFINNAINSGEIEVSVVGAVNKSSSAILTIQKRSGYYELDKKENIIQLRIERLKDQQKNYHYNVDSFNIVDDATIVLASGVFSDSSISEVPNFGLWLSLPQGGDLIELNELEPTSFNEALTSKFSVFPNPCSDQIIIQAKKIESIMIYDISGKLILNQSNLNCNTLDVTNLKNGMYQMLLISDGELINKSFVVKH